MHVDVVLRIVSGHDMQHRLTLLQTDDDMAVLRLIALDRLHVGVFQQGFLHLARADKLHGLRQGIELLPLQQPLHLCGTKQSALVVVDVDVHFGTYRSLVIGPVEGGDSQQQIGCNDDVEQNDDGMFPVDGHVLFLL